MSFCNLGFLVAVRFKGRFQSFLSCVYSDVSSIPPVEKRSVD